MSIKYQFEGRSTRTAREIQSNAVMCGSLSFPRGRTRKESTTTIAIWSFVVHHLLFTGRGYREALIPCICRTSPVEKPIALVVWSAPNADPSALCTRRTARAHPQGAATNRFSALCSML